MAAYLSRGKRAGRGFTLVEVLIALAILAVALAASSRATQFAVDQSDDAKDRVLARWVAQNRLAELSIERSPQTGSRANGRAAQGGREYTWRQAVDETPNATIRRVTVDVTRSDTPDRTLATITGFLAAPK